MIYRLLFVLSVTVFLAWGCKVESTTVDPLEDIISSLSDDMQKVAKDTSRYQVQIRYTQIDRDENGKPSFLAYEYNVDPQRYFYPASTVKMPVAFLALQRINELHEQYPEIDRYTQMKFDAGIPPQLPMEVDSSSPTGYPNVAHFVEQIFSVSDNEAYIRLYEFLGQDYINQELREKGIFKNSRIRTRVGIGGYDTEANKYTNPVSFIDKMGNVLYEQDEYYALYDDFVPLKNTLRGKGYYDSSQDTVIMTPFDMSEKNFITIEDLEASLMRVIFPKVFPELTRYRLTEEQYFYLYDLMPKTPLDFSFHQDHAEDYFDSYVKFFWKGDDKTATIPDHIKIYNKVGWAYGTLTDCAYIKDTKNDIDFFLTATILVNENGIYNDGEYQYEEIGLPFLAALGQAVYKYEMAR